MNVHDSERIKGLLESLGARRGTDAGRRRRGRLQHLHDPREGRRAASSTHLMQARAAKERHPERSIVVGGCWSESMKDELFERYPFVDLAFGPGQHLAARRLHRRGRRAAARALLDVRRVRGRPARAPRAPAPGVGADLDGLQLDLLVLHRAVGARPRAVAVARDRWSPPRSRRSSPTACARSRCSARTSTRGAATSAGAERIGFGGLLRRLDGVVGLDRIRYTSPHPKDMRDDVIAAHRECAGGLRARPPAAAVGLDAHPARACAAPTRASATSHWPSACVTRCPGSR